MGNQSVFAAVALLAGWLFSAGAIAEDKSQATLQQDVTQAVDWQTLTTLSPWVFLGDSNTYAGGYVAELETRLRPTQPQLRLLNLGVSSETCSGLSEVDHPFKRPCVQERLDKVLRMTQPGVVFVCYGMNDGIYDPPNAERMAAYKAGMLLLAEQVKAAEAALIVLTPPIFEPEPVAASGKFGPTEAGRYAYFAPYQRYDDVLEQQAEWCLKNEFQAAAVIDIRSLLKAEKAQRLTSEPTFSYSKDGVHFGAQAHALIAQQILASLQAPPEVLSYQPAAEELSAAIRRTQLRRDAYLSATGKNRPGLPAGLPIWQAEKLAEQIK